MGAFPRGRPRGAFSPAPAGSWRRPPEARRSRAGGGSPRGAARARRVLQELQLEIVAVGVDRAVLREIESGRALRGAAEVSAEGAEGQVERRSLGTGPNA